jgi:hypothetical protein
MPPRGERHSRLASKSQAGQISGEEAAERKQAADSQKRTDEGLAAEVLLVCWEEGQGRKAEGQREKKKNKQSRATHSLCSLVFKGNERFSNVQAEDQLLKTPLLAEGAGSGVLLGRAKAAVKAGKMAELLR